MRYSGPYTDIQIIKDVFFLLIRFSKRGLQINITIIQITKQVRSFSPIKNNKVAGSINHFQGFGKGRL